MKKIMHLNAFMIHSPMNHTVGSWTHPDSTVGSSFAQPDLWQDIAKTLERGKFDAIFDAQRAFGAAGVWVKVGFPLAPSPLGGEAVGFTTHHTRQTGH